MPLQKLYGKTYIFLETSAIENYASKLARNALTGPIKILLKIN